LNLVDGHYGSSEVEENPEEEIDPERNHLGPRFSKRRGINRTSTETAKDSKPLAARWPWPSSSTACLDDDGLSPDGPGPGVVIFFSGHHDLGCGHPVS
jgi:hypothetical protein